MTWAKAFKGSSEDCKGATDNSHMISEITSTRLIRAAYGGPDVVLSHGEDRIQLTGRVLESVPVFRPLREIHRRKVVRHVGMVVSLQELTDENQALSGRALGESKSFSGGKEVLVPIDFVETGEADSGQFWCQGRDEAALEEEKKGVEQQDGGRQGRSGKGREWVAEVQTRYGWSARSLKQPSG